MTGQTTAHYRITAKLDEGGMDAVCRASGTKLNREVAVKVLPDAFASNPERSIRKRQRTSGFLSRHRARASESAPSAARQPGLSAPPEASSFCTFRALRKLNAPAKLPPSHHQSGVLAKIHP